MKILEKMRKKQEAPEDHEGVTIAFLGDSVTQGCFEIYKRADGGIETGYDSKNNYGARLSEMLGLLFPSVPINMICAGRSGDSAPRGSLRVSRDVIRHAPDLAIVCYGLNDCSRGENSEKRYTQALASIFDQLLEREIEVIFMTPNMMNTALLSNHINHPLREMHFLFSYELLRTIFLET